MTRSTILLVEDNPDDIELTRLALEENRIANELVVASSGDEALAVLFGDGNGQPPLVPALVLLDLKLPRVGGIEVLRRIRGDARMRLTPVVVLTSSDEERDLVESYTLGVNSYVRKPIDYADFVDAVRQLGIYWLLLNLTPDPMAQS
ncbi:MAG TPA: response regulator [Thermoanaerobaculia bacterium]|nr:response regulator [Thermoanaerobaculia bacterium]